MNKTTEKLNSTLPENDYPMFYGAASGYAPGPGWKHIGSAVWEHITGVRIHVGGLVRLPDLTFISLNRWPEGRDGWRFINICGGNRKRGLMAWAVNLKGNVSLRGE